MKRVFILFLYALILAGAIPARAGSITMQTYATSTLMDDGGVRVNVTTTNIGHEAAMNVQVHAIFQDTRKSSKIIPLLKPRQSYRTFIDIRPELALPGSYPIEILVDFHDANGYLFSSLAHTSFVYKQGVNNQVFVKAAETVLTGSTKMTLEVLNTDRTDREVTIRLIVPRELRVSPARQTVRVKARGKSKVSFRLKNFSALEGSAYPVLSFLEYVADGLHYSNVAESRVQVTAPQNFFKRHTPALIIVTAVLGIIVVLFQITRSARKG